MIGIATSPSSEPFAAELFELFKTPWEPAVPGRKYPVVVSTDGDIDHLDAGLFLVYSPNQTAVDRISGISLEAVQSKGPVDVRYSELTFPVYGRISTFSAIGSPASFTVDRRALECQFCAGGRYVRRIGYDLFDEIRYLLTEGQPPTHALVPTLELHIESLRRLLLDAGVPFVEIPPRPDTYDFVGCLTHDVDFFGIRRHRFDRTLAGFVARASLGTLAELLKGRRSLGEAGRNWAALLTLPFVLLGLARDFWLPFQDYARVEESSRSTFFLVPFKGRPGKALTDAPEPVRAAPYGIGEVRGEVGEAHDRGTEIAVHGIDAWSDADAGRAELAELLSVTGQRSAGIRMHWLYFDKGSPAQLEKAGFDYDSTWGYNEAVGYRAGTSQAFRFPQCQSPDGAADVDHGHGAVLSRKDGPGPARGVTALSPHRLQLESARWDTRHQLAWTQSGARAIVGRLLSEPANRNREREPRVVHDGGKRGRLVPLAPFDSLRIQRRLARGDGHRVSRAFLDSRGSGQGQPG